MPSNWGIREAVCERTRSLTSKQLLELIHESQMQQEEKNLPGLGVFFELIWKGSKEEEQKNIIETLHNTLQNPKLH